jgi:hypothetical protein
MFSLKEILLETFRFIYQFVLLLLTQVVSRFYSLLFKLFSV